MFSLRRNRNRRWSDRQKQFGPFTFSFGGTGWGVVLDSGDEESPGCHLRIQVPRATVIVELPSIIKPFVGEYGQRYSREFGFRCAEGFLQVFYGPQAFDSSTSKVWCKFLPWTQWRHVRRTLFDDKGNQFATFDKRTAWDGVSATESVCPTATFTFKDFDGAVITATTRVEEREWRFGTGWFRWLWLGFIRKVHRSLDIRFSDEVGPEKGSWKGGVTGTSISMLPGESHEAAFRRYCQQTHTHKGQKYRVTFVEPGGA
jgi:hypothetical protein